MAFTACGALDSLMQIIDELHHHPSPPITLDKLQLQSLAQNTTFFQDFLKGYDFHVDSKETDHLVSSIAKVAYAAEEVIESYTVENIPLERQRRLPKLFSRYYNKMLTLCKRKFSIPSCPPRSYSDEQIRYTIFYEDLQKVIKEMDSIKKVAMEMAREKAVQDLQQQRRPDVSASVVFPGSPSIDIKVEIEKVLSGTRILLVLDDMWETVSWDETERFFPDNNNGSRVLEVKQSSLE